MPVDFSLTPEQEEIRALAHQFAEREIRPLAAEYDEREETPWPVIRKAQEVGLGAAAALPVEYGGGGLDHLTWLLVIEELAWGDAGIAVSITASSLAAAAILAMGSEEQKARYLGVLCDSKEVRLGALGLTEPESGSDSLALRTTAERVDGGYLLNGTKQFCTNGGIAEIQVIFATLDRNLGPAGVTAFVVEKDNPGMHQGRKERKLGVRASHTAQVILQDCFVAEGARLGFDASGQIRGPGASGAMATLDDTRPGVAAAALGIARAAFEYARDYALQREQFGKPIAGHQAIAFKLADMATEIDATRLLVWRAGWLASQGHGFPNAEGSMAKLMAGDVAMRTTVEALQVLGGYGYTKDHPVERWMRDAKIYQIWEGTAEIQRLVIARAVLGIRI
jgi:alkylation response protein AidB-like acyl-CoA dehydrogenase